MKVSLETMTLNYFVMKMTLLITFLVLEHLNKMGLLKGRTCHYKKWVETLVLESGLSKDF